MPTLGTVRGGVDARQAFDRVAIEVTAAAAPARPTICSHSRRLRRACGRERDAILRRQPSRFTDTGNGQGTVDAREQR
jgi:hypothetical protein